MLRSAATLGLSLLFAVGCGDDDGSTGGTLTATSSATSVGPTGGSGGPGSATSAGSSSGTTIGAGTVATASTSAGETGGLESTTSVSSTTDSTSVSSTTDSTGDSSTSTTGALPLELAIELITDENRHHESMFGGWGPHLRGIMRDPMDRLWFTVDAGPDVLTNQSLRYFRRGPQTWDEVAAQPHTAGVQQNVASIMTGATIRSYGVNIGQSFLEECYLSTEDVAQRACNAILISGQVYTTPPASNYIGAAVDTEDTRIVWFTRVGMNGAAGDWIYTYNFGGGWNGPIVAPVLGGNDFAYVHASFVDPGTVALVGQLYYGEYPDGSFGAAVAEFKLGAQPEFVALGSGEDGVAILSSSDLYVDRQSGATHVLARDDKGGVRYYYKPAEGSWAAYAQPTTTIEGTFRARFVRPLGGDLMIARGDAGIESVDLLRVPGASAAQAVDWGSAESTPFPSPGPGFAPPSAIYVEGDACQSGPVKALSLGFCGEYKLADDEIWWGTVAGG